MSALDRQVSRFTLPGEVRERDGSEAARAPAAWFYTLAHAETPLRELALTEEDLRDLVETLRARNLPLPAELAASRARRARASDPFSGARYIWAFPSLRDALLAARANRRSDYHPYPRPATLREASLDRLYRRFPLDEFPRASVILFSGALACADPLLGPDPAPGSLAAELADAIGPDLWERYTLCGFRLGVSLVRVTSSDRWVRMAPRALEDAWAGAERYFDATPAPSTEDGDAPDKQGARPDPDEMEAAAFQALLGALTGVASGRPAPAPVAAARGAPRATTSRIRRERQG